VTGAAADGGVRYLDYLATGCTTLAIVANARLLLTGPLEGCFVAVGRANRNTFLFLANDNQTKDNPTQNKQNKIRMIEQAAMGYWACTLEELLMPNSYGDTSAPYRAFVFGVRNGTEDWDFYFHSATYDGGR
jgi:hypothetical protein